MVRAMCLALAMAALASGARYVDYSGVKMPEYGGAIDYEGPRDTASAAAHADHEDYHEHSQDAPAPLDYKYEEESVKRAKSPKEVEDTEEWAIPVKNHRKSLNDGNLEAIDNYSSDDIVPNYKSNHRSPKHRSRLRNSQTDDEIHTNKHAVRYSQYRKKDSNNSDRKDRSEDSFNDEKIIDFEDEKMDFNHRGTTARIARRKPRDRFIKNEPDEGDEPPLEIERRRPIKNEFRSADEQDAIRKKKPQIRRPSPRQKLPGEMKSEMLERMGSRLNIKTKPKKFDKYTDYYDMKRVQGIKDKLINNNLSVPPHRTVTTYLDPTMTPPFLGQLEGMRRAMNPHPDAYANYGDYTYNKEAYPEQNDTRDNDTASEPPIEETTYDDEQDTAHPNQTTIKSLETMPTKLMTSPNTSSMTLQSTKISVTTIPSTDILPIERTTIGPSTTEEEEEETEKTTVLSFAEKSRLSILKKAQRKEMLKESITKKPPVLMQVTNKLHTLVMVEPPTSERPWAHAREVLEDTPENLMNVKRLMRRKLVANAKNIHDLTENWDDMVCDYIDMSVVNSLVQKKAVTTRPGNSLIMLLSVIIIFAIQ